jgi:hypothetical protein
MSLRERVRPTWGTSAYVGTVAATAAAGFVADSTALILIAALVALPASVLAMPGYYVAYGLVALVPGANPSSSSGYQSCSPDGTCHGSVEGELAAWFAITADALGIVALTGAALVNVVGLRAVIARRQRRGDEAAA